MKRRDVVQSLAVRSGMCTRIHKSAAQGHADPIPAGKLGSLGRTRCAAVLAALLLGLLLGGGTATAQAQSVGSTWLKIMAFADAPVVGAEVRVSVYGRYGWPLVDVPAATNQYGVFPVAVPSRLSSFRVTISGGTINGQPFPGRLSRDVVLTDPAHQIVVINPVTTLVSRLLDRRPELALDQAEARVRSFLTLPANYSLGLALRQSSGYVSRFFSPIAFLTEAQAAGGLDAFANLLLEELLAADSATHSFRPPPLLGSANNDASTAISITATGLEAGVLDYAGANNAGGAAAWGIGWGLSLTGLSIPGTSGGDISALVNALAQLQSAVEDLSNQVAQLSNLVQSTATQEQYNTIVVPALALESQVDTLAGRLSYFVSSCPPLAAGSTPTTPTQFCKTEGPAIISALNDNTIQSAYTTLQAYVSDNPAIGFRGMLHLYSLWLAQSKPFFRPADSIKMQNLYNYWDGVLTQAANLKVEFLHQEGAQDDPGGQKELTDFMGNPSLHPPTTGTFQANEATNQNLMFQPVPAGTVISTVDHTMWALVPWYPYNIATQGANSPYFPIDPVPDCLGGEAVHDPNNFATAQNNPYTGQPYASYNYTPLTWSRAPSKSQWEAAVKLAPSSGTNWQQWLIDQTKTTQDDTDAGASPSNGFFNSLSCSGVAAWSTTQSGSSFYVIHLDKDNFTTTGTGSNAHNFAWPVRQVGAYSGEQFVPEQYFWYQ